MKLSYKIIIDAPSTHQARVIIEGKKESSEKKLDFFLPRWSPGSYLIREYSRHISGIIATTSNGERLDIEQTATSVFEIDWNKSNLKKEDDSFTLSYFIYCHELTVRTSHIDDSHAFLHLPTLLMGILKHSILNPTLQLNFPPRWSHLTTGLRDISQKREDFIYSAANYDELIDSPIEIGCHETDGFQAFGVDHHLAFYGNQLPHKENIKADIKKIVEHIAGFMGGVPYEKYSFITHFSPGLYGGLEHCNSTALQFCPTQITNRKGYCNYLTLVAHEYFHTWNVKRIRPLELGPFNYLSEATTKLLWLAEGLTSLMDELFVYRMGLISIDEYLEMQKDNLNRYYATPGKKFHSLDDSSYNAWIKLYRPDENSHNSSISYYLKGGIVFFALNIMLAEKNKSIKRIQNLQPQVDFDWVFVPALPKEVVQILPNFNYFDAFNLNYVGVPSWRSELMTNEGYRYGNVFFMDESLGTNETPFTQKFTAKYNKQPKFVETISYDSLKIASNIIEADKNMSTRQDLDLALAKKVNIQGESGQWKLDEDIWMKDMSTFKIKRDGVEAI